MRWRRDRRRRDDEQLIGETECFLRRASDSFSRSLEARVQLRRLAKAEPSWILAQAHAQWGPSSDPWEQCVCGLARQLVETAQRSGHGVSYLQDHCLAPLERTILWRLGEVPVFPEDVTTLATAALRSFLEMHRAE